MNRTGFWRNTYTRLVALMAGSMVFTTAAMAQVEQHSQISIQGTGLVAKDTDSDSRPLSQHTTKSGGFLVGYSYHFNSWAGVEGNYGYSQNTINTTGSFGRSPYSSVRTDFHEFGGAFVAHIPLSVRGVRPYALGGAAALMFQPTDDAKIANAGVDRQTKAAFVYGGGADYDVTHFFGIRAEYRGFVYKATDFKLDALDLDKVTHLAQPSVGFYFRF